MERFGNMEAIGTLIWNFSKLSIDFFAQVSNFFYIEMECFDVFGERFGNIEHQFVLFVFYQANLFFYEVLG